MQLSSDSQNPVIFSYLNAVNWFNSISVRNMSLDVCVGGEDVIKVEEDDSCVVGGNVSYGPGDRI